MRGLCECLLLLLASAKAAFTTYERQGVSTAVCTQVNYCRVKTDSPMCCGVRGSTNRLNATCPSNTMTLPCSLSCSVRLIVLFLRSRARSKRGHIRPNFFLVSPAHLQITTQLHRLVLWGAASRCQPAPQHGRTCTTTLAQPAHPRPLPTEISSVLRRRTRVLT